MRLVYSDGPRKGQEVKVGDLVVKDNGTYVVKYFAKPHKPDSSGKVTVQDRSKRYECEYYVSVIGAEWIEREDQQ